MGRACGPKTNATWLPRYVLSRSSRHFISAPRYCCGTQTAGSFDRLRTGSSTPLRMTVPIFIRCLPRRPLCRYGLGQLCEGFGVGVAAGAEQVGVLEGVAGDGAGAVQLGSLIGQLLLAGGTEAALQLAFLFLEAAAVG